MIPRALEVFVRASIAEPDGIPADQYCGIRVYAELDPPGGIFLVIEGRPEGGPPLQVAAWMEEPEEAEMVATALVKAVEQLRRVRAEHGAARA